MQARQEPPVVTVLRAQPERRASIDAITAALKCTEKQARTAIDKARLDGFNIKNVDVRTFQLQPVIGAQTKP